MALNLLRNSRLFVSTDASATNLDQFDTWEVPIMSDFSFSQSNENTDITVNESGIAPVRGSARFNTALNPVEWNFSTYMRPYKTSTAQTGQELRSCMERIMWHGLVSPNNPDFTNGQNSECEGNTQRFHVDFSKSNSHTLKELTFYIKTDNTWYKITKVQINQAEIDFSIDTIGMITWSGMGATLTEIAAPTFVSKSTSTIGSPASTVGGTLITCTSNTNIEAGMTVTITGTSTGLYPTGYSGTAKTYYIKDTPTPTATSFTLCSYPGAAALTMAGTGTAFTGLTLTLNSPRVREFSTPVVASGNTVSTTQQVADWIVQKYTTLTIVNTKNGVTYQLPITGGSITINNNITYLTPEVLSTVNIPIGSFTGSREISGSLSCYLKTSTGTEYDSGELLNELLSASSSGITNRYDVTFKAGGSNVPYIKFTGVNTMLSIPTVDVQDVMSMNMEFKFLPYSETTVSMGSLVVGNTYKLKTIGTSTHANLTTAGATSVAPSAAVVGTEYMITATGSTDFTLMGAANSTPGTIFTATAAGTGTGTMVRTYFTAAGVGAGTGDCYYRETEVAGVNELTIDYYAKTETTDTSDLGN